MKTTISDLMIYPVKSLAGIALNTCVATPFGLQGDREWMIVDEKGHFVTQRKIPSLTLIRVELNSHRPTSICLTTESGDSILVETPEAHTPISVTVWKDTCHAFIASDSVNEWITQNARSTSPLRLVKIDKSRTRPVDESRFGSNPTYFADAAPYLLANQSSLDKLNRELSATHQPEAIMTQFRPNIVIDNLPAFTEHNYTTLISEESDLAFKLCDPCQRCSVITIDPKTSLKRQQNSPFATLTKLNPMPAKPKAPAFGVNSVLTGSHNHTITIGMEMRLS